MLTHEIEVKTLRHDMMLDITADVVRAVAASGVTHGAAIVYCPHTTGAITINENADPDVTNDMLQQLGKMVPWNQPFYAHDEGNSAAHVKSSMFGCSETIPIVDGKLLLGTWQGIYFCEFDGPRPRRAIVQILDGGQPA
ncbi:MAG: YjbQ family protein [Phycisphaerales bacterium]|jgi:secondary thiamine-phosphate synthase enzyme|nr:YjbQ family protein [Phycisphaerales bacterium]